MGLPRKALLYSKLLKETAGSAAIDGSHQIIKVTFIEDGVSKTGFFKRLEPKNHYPELLAKISVATSVIKRLFQGKRSADERLVFDDNGQIVGTLSIGVEGFEPFNYADEPVPTDANTKERVIPSTNTLIEKNIMEILFGRIILDDDDGHPHNLSLAGDIDFDMFWYWFTIHMKEPRAVIGIPKTWIRLTVEDWEDLPRVRETGTYHCAGNQYPGEHTLPPMPVVNRFLPKAYADPSQFQQLANKPKAKEQQLAAALKFLLTFQPEVLRKRLEEAFGNMAFNYTSLDATNKDLRILYEQKFPHLCNDKTNKDSFVNFMMNMYQQHYDNVYRVVVFYMGCEKNLSREPTMAGIPLPATNAALYQKPSYFKDIQEWVKNQNATLYKDYKPEDGIRFDLDDLKKRYHQVWRDAHAPTLKELLHNCYSLCNQLQTLCGSDTTKPQIEGKKPTDDISSAWELFGTMPILSEDIEKKILVDKDNKYGDALKHLVQFTKTFHASVKKYYSKERKDLVEEDNLTFVKELQALLDSENLTIRESLANSIVHSLANSTTPAIEFNHIAVNLDQFTKQVNFRLHLTTTDEQMKAVSTKFVAKELLPIDSEEVMNQFNDSLFIWAKSLPSETFDHYITTIIKEQYKKTLTGNRHRANPVQDYLLKSTKVSNDQRLAYILTSGSKDDGALNKLLIEHLAPLVMEKYTNPSVSKAIRERTFNKDIVTKFTLSAITFARHDKRFLNLFNTEGMKLFYATLFAWVEKLPKDQFHALINSCLQEYLQGLSYFRLTESRKKEIQGYLDSKMTQSKIVAFIFLKGEDTSTLNAKLFSKIIDKMRLEIKDNPDNNLGYHLVTEYNETTYPNVYKGIKGFAGEISHKQTQTATTPPASMAV